MNVKLGGKSFLALPLKRSCCCCKKKNTPLPSRAENRWDAKENFGEENCKHLIDCCSELKGPYNANSTFIVLLYVHMPSWHVSQPTNAWKKTIHAACCDSSMSDTIRLSAPNFCVLHQHVIGPHAYVGSLATIGPVKQRRPAGGDLFPRRCSIPGWMMFRFSYWCFTILYFV